MINDPDWRQRRDELIGFIILCNRRNSSNCGPNDARSVRPVLTCESVLEAMRERMPEITAAQRVDFVYHAKLNIPVQ